MSDFFFMRWFAFRHTFTLAGLRAVWILWGDYGLWTAFRFRWLGGLRWSEMRKENQ